MAGRLEFRILGPLAVRVDGVVVPAGGPKQRALLALLLLGANRVVSRDQLVSEVFPEQSVVSADHALRNHVSRLRKVLAPAVGHEPRLVARAPGYLLRVEPGELDLDDFERLLLDGQEALSRGDAAAAAESLRAAESLWHGRPFADLELEPFARLEVDRLGELQLAAVESRIEAELALGRQLALVPELERLTSEFPLRERFSAQLMLALYRSGRQAEGLEVYRRTHRLLDDELGLAPGTELQALERAILVQDPALELRADATKHVAPAATRSVCPFKGLAPFDAADAEYFFGRERLVDELVARLAEAPLLALIGASGSGKSSLLRAGLLPALDPAWRRVVLRPGERPTDQLAHIPRGEHVVLVVDQFEEVFAATVSDDERRTFVSDLVETAWDPDRRTTTLLALRADFFGHLAPYGELADLIGANQYLLGPMNAAELRRAIEGPAARVGLSVESELVDALVDDVAGEAGALPLLSTALLDLWRDRDESKLTVEAYERLGGVRTAVARHAESAFSSLDDEEQRIARRIFVRLVAGEEGEPLTRRRATHAELEADDDSVSRVLQELVERRLLVAHDDSIELVHEALLSRWPRLTQWLEDDVEGLRVRRRLAEAAKEWSAEGRGGELLRGARLSATLEWFEAAGDDSGLNRTERDYLEQSRLAAAAESLRQRRSNRRLRIALAAAVTTLLAAVGAGVVALEQRGNARRQATAAVAQQVGAQALVEPALDRSLLLAREGVDLDDSLATRSNLLAALLRSPAAIGIVREGSKRLLDEALSPDGRVLAVRGDDGGIAFFDTRTLGKLGTTLSGSDQLGLMGATSAPFHALAFSPDARTVAIGSTTGNDATLELVDSRTRVARSSRSDSQQDTVDVAFSPDGRQIATGEPVTGEIAPPDEVVVVRDARSARTLATSAPIPAGRLVGFIDGARHLLVTSDTQSVVLRSDTLKQERVLPDAGAAGVSPRGDEIAFGHRDGSVVLLDLRTGRRHLLSGRVPAAITVSSFSPDGETLATGEESGAVALWNVRTGAIRETLTGHTGSVRGAVFSPDGNELFTASYDGSVIVWDVGASRTLGQSFRFAPSADVSTWADASRGGVFALSPGPGRVTLWRLAGHEPVGELRGPVGGVRRIALSRDARFLAAVGDDKAVLWDVRSRRVLRVVPTGPHGANGIAISPDDRIWAIGTEDRPNAILFFDVRSGKTLGQVYGGGSIQELDFSPDGKLLVSADLTGIGHVWNVAKRSAVSTLPGTVAAFTTRFSPDGKLIAVGDSSGSVVLWNPATGKQVGPPLAGGGGSVSSIDFDPTGRMLVTGNEDGKLRLWDVATGKLIGGPLPGATVSRTWSAAAFFPDGTHLLGAFGDGTAVVWDVDPSAWKSAACKTANRELTRSEWSTYLPGRAYSRVCT